MPPSVGGATDMYNVIVDRLPVTVEIDGMEVPINTDFRTGILFEQLLNDHEVSDKERLALALQLYYPIVPQNVEAAIEKAAWFYSCGAGIPAKRQESAAKPSKSARRIVDYDVDCGLIYAAFLSDYKIDLVEKRDLHWWKYHALFENLSEENRVVKIMQYRGMDLNSIKNKEQRRFYAKMQAKYKLRPLLTREEMLERAGIMFAPKH